MGYDWMGYRNGVLVLLVPSYLAGPARELTDLGTELYIETITLILRPKSAVFLGGFWP